MALATHVLQILKLVRRGVTRPAIGKWICYKDNVRLFDHDAVVHAIVF